jgi:hypothetical protein
LNLGACIQQGDYQHRGEQGMFEAVGFKLFNLAGIEAPHTHWIQFRVIDDAVEADPGNQYEGDFWGLYLALEQEDGRFLEEHALPDGNFYKMEGGSGELNHQGSTAVTDRSDLNQFLNTYRSSQTTDSWWRTNLDLPRYYSYRAILECIHHYDIDEGAGKNYYYFLNPETAQWSVHPWDLDLTWANNMYGGGNSPFKNRVLPRPDFSLEYKNRLREIRDLLFNSDQAGQLIDEFASVIHDFSGQPAMTGADRAQWDYNPIMTSSYVLSSKAGQGRFYQVAPTKDFPGMVNLMKNYVSSRGTFADSLASDPAIPATPVINSTAPALFPANRLSFRTSDFQGNGGSFGAMKWRIAEVTPLSRPAFDPAQPRKYEIHPVWESPELTAFNPVMAIPAGVVKVGHTYRVRARMKDNTGRWSHWSGPIEFVAGEPDNTELLRTHLRLTELMFNPAGGSDYEFIELHNQSPETALDLGGAVFTQGIELTLPPGTVLPPGGYLVVTQASDDNDYAEFRRYYSLDSTVRIVGPYQGSLDNSGESITLKSASAGEPVFSFRYRDNAGWPAAADGADYSLVVREADRVQPPGEGRLDYPGFWRASYYPKGTPGRGDLPTETPLVINEIMAHTDFADPKYPGYDSNDWIELYNPGSSAVDLGDGWYLSDDAGNLKKWRLPVSVLESGRWMSYDEVTGFHNPLTEGFGLNKAGEFVWLSHFPDVGPGRIVDVVRFGGQAPETSWGRYPDGGEDWRALAPSRGLANNTAVPDLLISEIGYVAQPERAGDHEFIELYNASDRPVNLFNTNGIWRINGGIDFVFEAGTILAPGELLVVVDFDPSDSALVQQFWARFGADTPRCRLQGPFANRLSDASDRVAVERPQAPDEPDEAVSWVTMDEVIYSSYSPWPTNARSAGLSLQRTGLAQGPMDPQAWLGLNATPGETQLNLVKPTIRFEPPLAHKDDHLTLLLSGGGAASLQIEASDDLIEWSTVSTHTSTGALITVEVGPLNGIQHRFYRARRP